MGLKKTMQKAAVTAFKSVGDIVIKAQYVKTIDDGFDNSQVFVQELSLIKEEKKTGAYANHWEDMFSEKVLVTDIVCMTPTASCAQTVEEGAVITVEGQKYTLKSISTDPADAVYSLLLRKI